MVLKGDVIEHYGTKRHSGRYPWGSGKDDEHSRSEDLLTQIEELKKKGYSQVGIAEALGYSSTTQLRKAKSIAYDERKQVLMDKVTTMRKRGMSNTEIAKELDMPESTVRYTVSNSERIQNTQLKNTSDMLKDTMVDKPYLDVGPGVELQLGISRQKLRTAVAQLKEEGYYEHKIYVPQVNDPSVYTTVLVLSKEKDPKVVAAHKLEISAPNQKSDDGGLTYSEKIKAPENISWDRVGINYRENGGLDRDGLIQVRRGAKDLDLGSAKYAQVRIAVGGTHYLKGMAMYSDDLPAGKDLVFNTNKSKSTPKEEVLKPLKSDAANPFGANIISQRGAFNIVNEEGTWDTWHGDVFSAQFLSKQPLSLVKDRINATYSKQKNEFDEINKLTNPVVKRMLLRKYAEQIDKQEKELSVLGLPRTKSHVLLPFPDMKPNEVYAPNYNNGERVVLIRYPHAGTFEIPELTVNNRAPSPKKALGAVSDAIGIHPSVAAKLSGADFDGDTVFVIPNNKKQIKSSPTLKGLKDFDPNTYQVKTSKPTIDKKTRQHQMGNVSNLIADMTIKGASVSEITRAVRHSMVVIDALKHNLDWKKSAEDNGIAALRKKYETRPTLTYDPISKQIKKGRNVQGGSTLVTRADSTVKVGYKHKFIGYSKDANGNRVPVYDKEPMQKFAGYLKNPDGSYKIDKDGKKIADFKPVEVRKYTLDLVGDAAALSSGNPKENAYAGYINNLKSLYAKATDTANHIYVGARDRKASMLYSNEVSSLNKKLQAIDSNAPKERRAQIIANSIIRKYSTPDMSKDEKNKLRRAAMEKGRINSGAKSHKDLTIDFTAKEWEAIQSGAVSPTMLEKLLNNADLTKVKQLATPRPKTKLNSAKISRAQTLLSNGYSYAEVANVMGVSASTLRYNLNESKGA